MRVSKQALIGILTIVATIFAAPQVLALIPEHYLAWVLLVAGASTLVSRWLGGALGLNPLTGLGVAQLALAVLAMPELLAVVPVTALPILTTVSGILQLLLRVLAGQSGTDPAKPVVNLLLVKTP